MFKKIIATDKDYAASIARWALAIVFFPHGAQKVLGWFGGDGFSASMEGLSGGLGLPAIVAFLVITGEFLGPIGLAVGLLSRVAAFGLGVIMIGAATMHVQHGFFMNWFGQQQGEGVEYHLLAIGLTIVVMIKGSGALSIDRTLSA